MSYVGTVNGCPIYYAGHFLENHQDDYLQFLIRKDLYGQRCRPGEIIITKVNRSHNASEDSGRQFIAKCTKDSAAVLHNCESEYIRAWKKVKYLVSHAGRPVRVDRQRGVFLVRSHHGFGDLSCEANATFNYFNSLDAQAAHDDIQLSLKINYIFLSGDKGVMMLSGLANDGEERYFVNRRVNFSYVSQGSFYRFHYGEVNYSPRDTLPDEVYTYFSALNRRFIIFAAWIRIR